VFLKPTPNEELRLKMQRIQNNIMMPHPGRGGVPMAACRIQPLRYIELNEKNYKGYTQNTQKIVEDQSCCYNNTCVQQSGENYK
jgi:hypothetical protein